MKKKMLLSVLAAGLVATTGFGVANAMGLEEADGYPSAEQIDKMLDENLNKQLEDWKKAAEAGKPAEMKDFNGRVRPGSTEDYIPGLDKKLEENVAKGADKVLDKVAEKAKADKPAAKKPMAKKALPKTSAVK